ncbi:rhodanese-like domain-containing protein [Marinisporobacter balticus]|uniref:Rhodanese-related sulfurtransferase n=1 Tax=Marinisporobacter balticus TaxID=2018667 RepID=A0A4R2L570_9FIRM|nr:rhodanese-like domain-containing protein [Marinisporobacter balticus]TCO79149.1 rhodanese-related sulfurtransferase [Marinisporobacter balticus]
MISRNKCIMTLLIIVFLTFGLTACQNVNDAKIEHEESVSQDVEYKIIKPSDAKERLDKEEGIILLDVRTKEEYAEKHIPNSLLIPVDEIEEQIEEKISDKNTIIFVYCRSGRRSRIASEKLIEMGYTDVFDLGGIIDWPYETEIGQK